MSRRSSNATSRRAEPRGASSDRGISLIALVASVAIIMIGFMMTVPTWRYFSQRENEEELLFRGFQIVSAIRAFQKNACIGGGGGTFPVSLKQLVDAKCLRREYKDPFTEKKKGGGEWTLVMAGAPRPECMVQQTGDNRRSPPQPFGPGEDLPGILNAGQGILEDPYSLMRPDAGPSLLAVAGQWSITASPILAQGRPQGPISGVISRDPRESYRVFNFKNTYDKWCFSVELIPETVYTLEQLRYVFMTFTPDKKPKFTGKGKKDPERKSRKRQDDAGDPFGQPDEAPPDPQ